MKTMTTLGTGNDEFWAPIPRIAECLRCTSASLHSWGKSGNFGYRQITPRHFIVCVPEVLAFYTSRYPNIEIDLDGIDAVLQHTA